MLIAFEGLDQSGKETQARQLRVRVEQTGRHVRLLSFPEYGTPVGQEIEKGLAGDRDYAADVMQLLYVANRFEYKSKIELWIGAGDVIICDRYTASTVAYGEAQGLDPAWLLDIQRPLPAATVTVLLDIAPETAAARKAHGRDLYERDLALLGRVRQSYRRQADANAWLVIDGARSKNDVAAAIAQAVVPQLERP